MVISVQNDEQVSVLYKYLHLYHSFFSRQDKKHCIDEISHGFSKVWFKIFIHTISILNFRTITQASLPYQDAVIIVFKMSFKKAAMISCAKRI